MYVYAIWAKDLRFLLNAVQRVDLLRNLHLNVKIGITSSLAQNAVFILYATCLIALITDSSLFAHHPTLNFLI